MLPAMQPRVLVHDVDPDAPREATRHALSSAFAQLPPARSVLAAVVGWGDGPGLEPAPWTLDGVLSAGEDADVRVRFESLGPYEPTATHRWLRANAATQDDDRRPIILDVPGARRPRRVPRAWIGRHLCLVVPCVHVGRRTLGRATSWVGPFGAAFEALALATRGARAPRGESHRDGMLALVGRRVAAQVFASTTILVDASWWAPLHHEGNPRRGTAIPPATSHLVALERCLVMSTTSPGEHWSGEPLSVDAWLGARMGMAGGATRHGGETPRWVGPAAARRWPTQTSGWFEDGARPSRVAAVADRALEALWRLGDRGRARGAARLPPAVPGPLARHWHELGANDFRRRHERGSTGDATRRP
jgi:hypothetical protein